MVPDHLCFPFLRSPSAKTENKKEESTAVPELGRPLGQGLLNAKRRLRKSSI